MLVIENCNSLSELRQKLIDGEEVRTARNEPCEDCISREDVLMCLTGEIKETDTIETIIARFGRRIRKLPPVKPQESCGDLIRREDAINAVSEALEHVVVENEDVARKMMNKLPSVNSQPKTGHWIPVSEELPDKEGYYLCSVRYMYPPYNFFEPEKVKYMDDVTIQKFDGEFNIEVKAWMPLPEPYKVESEGEA